MGFEIREIAIDWDNPTDSTVRIGIDPLLMFLDLLKITWKHRLAPSRNGYV